MAEQWLEVTAKITPHNREQVRTAIETLGALINQFKTLQTEEEIGEHVAHINGYCYALVNMDVLDAAQVNTKIRDVVIQAAASRENEIIVLAKNEIKQTERK